MSAQVLIANVTPIARPQMLLLLSEHTDVSSEEREPAVCPNGLPISQLGSVYASERDCATVRPSAEGNLISADTNQVCAAAVQCQVPTD